MEDNKVIAKVLGQFQPNFAQSIIRWMEFNFVKKGHILFQDEIIKKIAKYTLKTSPQQLGQLQRNLAQTIVGWSGI